MAGLPAVNGLYTSFFSMLLYAIFGTSRHFSAGTYAIVSLMTATSIKNFRGVLYSSGGNSTNDTITNDFLSDDVADAKTLISMSITLITGIIQVHFETNLIILFKIIIVYFQDYICNFASWCCYQIHFRFNSYGFYNGNYFVLIIMIFFLLDFKNQKREQQFLLLLVRFQVC